MAMIELKPCPFCGKKPHIDFLHKLVECLNTSCAAMPATWKYDTVPEAVEAWNARGGEKGDG